MTSKNTAHLKKKLGMYEREFEAEFISPKPTDVLWLDMEELSHKLRFTRTDVICVYCHKEIKILYLYSMVGRLGERLQGKICPNCNAVSLRR